MREVIKIIQKIIGTKHFSNAETLLKLFSLCKKKKRICSRGEKYKFSSVKADCKIKRYSICRISFLWKVFSFIFSTFRRKELLLSPRPSNYPLRDWEKTKADRRTKFRKKLFSEDSGPWRGNFRGRQQIKEILRLCASKEKMFFRIRRESGKKRIKNLHGLSAIGKNWIKTDKSRRLTPAAFRAVLWKR